VLNVNNVGHLGLKWTYTTGEISGNDGLGFEDSSPAVVNGVIYFGSLNGNVYALNANTAVLLWSYATAGYITSSPAVANGVIYIGSWDGNIYALNSRDQLQLQFPSLVDHVGSEAVRSLLLYKFESDLPVNVAGGGE
jgi:outer membrane protein assembly factor BamB